MQDSVWPSACCAPTIKGEATTCVRQSAMKWMCELETMVNTKAYAATVRKASPLAFCALNSLLLHAHCPVAYFKQCLSMSLLGGSCKGLDGHTWC